VTFPGRRNPQSLEETSALDGIEHVRALDGRRAVIIANHLSYSDANLLEILLQRSGGRPMADRLTVMAGPWCIDPPLFESVRELASAS
jgi:hypothetical protein